MTAVADAILVIGIALTVARSGGGSLEGPRAQQMTTSCFRQVRLVCE